MSEEGLGGRIRSTDGFPVGHAVLTVTDPAGKQVARVPADAAGVVAGQPGTSLPPGAYTAVVTAPGYLPVARTALIRADGGGSLGDVVLEPAAGALPLPPAGPWVIDPAHSSVVTTARHLGISSIKARFTGVSGRIEVARPPERSSVLATIEAATIDTGVAMRDDHLRSSDFLDVAAYPWIEFASTGLRREGTDTWTLSGELTLHGQRRHVELDLRYGGVGPDPWGGVRAAFSAETLLHRQDFAINYNAMVRAGVAAVGTTVRVELDIQAVRGEHLPEPPG
ncbi:Polyisoprenoid-binding protein YceI [Amycolatopsis arida]|uniref:Polyisoprenoid-binding protein YceI n=1 Tax=Amycolatopsis arida TaxID=587909 RepID=A0A1I5T6V8_9PSEU|nr:YceI family protein [Amycolatopsis arida]TDX96224.1 polyisoprenoid-binding protein YceI [Amycolatopsis arida]SFP78216.1 Polyisoprenoid-binding protein YceI [Amycolatopsis arida]